ncbi:MAG: hypothetical protein Q9O24_12645 [Gammaproteobacteria bacterium]|nr:hypothetical protein [Gammaproteobacteria bacterium]
MNSVLRCAELEPKALEAVLAEYGLQLIWLAEGETITGSFWGDEEAGLVANRLYVRPDTPVHSALHEACHYLCMDGQRRAALDTDAAGDYDEENGVCYLQILLAERLPMGRKRMWLDMDAWGYSFRLGSAQVWFERDAEDAVQWLQRYGLLDEMGVLTGKLRV